jgi:RNA polymerase sigma factor (sigma-70 family)
VSPSDTELVESATESNEEAWEQLISRYQPLINSISRRHRLDPSDAQDVSQYVWMQLLSHLHNLREPNALPGWIAATTRHRCYEVLRNRKRSVSVDPLVICRFELVDTAVRGTSSEGPLPVDDALLRAEQRSVVRQGLAELREDQQQLLLLLVADPPVPYDEISRRMKLPIGSIGPTRARLLRKLQRNIGVRLLIEELPTKASAAA